MFKVVKNWYKGTRFYTNRKIKAKRKALKEFGRWVDPDTKVCYFDSSRWTSPTRMRKIC